MTGRPQGIEGRRRVVIEGVKPEIDAGRFPIKRTVGERVVVEADVFADGHDVVHAALLHRPAPDEHWREQPMEPLGNDRWRAEFRVHQLGRYEYTIEGWTDRYATWLRDLRTRVEAREDVPELLVALLIGADLVAATCDRARVAGASSGEVEALADATAVLRGDGTLQARLDAALEPSLVALVERYPDRRFATRYDRELRITVDPERARFGAWYEMFPRSTGEGGVHGTFGDAARRLDYVASMGFDVLYLPPIHPVGTTFRKGRNNSTAAAPDEVGVPWAIGSPEGGHTSVHPELGTLDDFRSFVSRARELGMQVALDIAFQTSPDHPFVGQHPEWYLWRPDGTVQYAENPPKKYQDIFPFFFETDAWGSLWEELRDIFLYWIDQGVTIFRVDNPHTKPFPFWEWLIADVKKRYPQTIFLAEAFTRPRVVYRLAKLGFTQSYNYFPWRNTKAELTEYLTELTKTEVREYFRPNLWPNTPDILTEFLQHGGRAAFAVRFVLAATLGASYGIYGPAYELGVDVPREPGSEEYLDSEKYELKQWPIERPDSLRDLVAAVNRARRENEALQSDWSLEFLPVENDEIMAYSKRTDDCSSVVLVVVSLDPHRVQSGVLELPLAELGLDPGLPYEVHDLISGSVVLWHGARQQMDLDPKGEGARLLALRRAVRTEQQFEAYS